MKFTMDGGFSAYDFKDDEEDDADIEKLKALAGAQPHFKCCRMRPRIRDQSPLHPGTWLFAEQLLGCAITLRECLGVTKQSQAQQLRRMPESFVEVVSLCVAGPACLGRC